MKNWQAYFVELLYANEGKLKIWRNLFEAITTIKKGKSAALHGVTQEMARFMAKSNIEMVTVINYFLEILSYTKSSWGLEESSYHDIHERWK